MKRHLIIFFFLFSLSSFGQNILLDNVKAGDTLEIIIERMGDRFGPYAGDTLLLVAKTTDKFIYSSKRAKWYKLTPQTYKTLSSLEKIGAKEKYSGQRVDLYTIKKHDKLSAFSLAPNHFDRFLIQLKSDSPDNHSRLND